MAQFFLTQMSDNPHDREIKVRVVEGDGQVALRLEDEIDMAAIRALRFFAVEWFGPDRETELFAVMGDFSELLQAGIEGHWVALRKKIVPVAAWFPNDAEEQPPEA